MSACPSIPLNLRLPRYTSYPTAPHFSRDIGPETHTKWVEALGPDEAVSLYFHIPFCAELCHYCGCQTSVVRNYTPIAAYVDRLLEEITMISVLAGRRQPVSHIHFGGGSPDMLHPDDFTRIMTLLRDRFDLSTASEIALEIDPRVMKPGLALHLASLGFNRASLGVQDFDPGVQEAIGREQSIAVTRAAVKDLRAAGFTSVNLDLVYGLPKQTTETLARTIARALSLAPDRISLFGYAHVPWMKRHQQLIREEWLPGSTERLAQFEMAAKMLTEVGMVAIGLDHYALPGDPMAVAAEAHQLHRNFQGYTTDRAKVLIGFGASSISQFPGGYTQNAPATPAYLAAIGDAKLATVRGYHMSPEDHMRAEIIEKILCDMEVDVEIVARHHGFHVSDLESSMKALVEWEKRNIVFRHRNFIKVGAADRIWLRHIAAAFDAYLGEDNTTRHSLAV